MAKIRIKLYRGEVRKLMKRPETKEILKGYADAALSKIGGSHGYEVSQYTGKNRANVSIRAASASARRDNAENNTLLKAVKNL